MASNFVQRMADAKAAKAARGMSGSSHKSHTARRKTAPIVKGSWDYAFAAARAAWQNVVADACEDFRREVFPERYEAFDAPLPGWEWLRQPAAAPHDEEIPF